MFKGWLIMRKIGACLAIAALCLAMLAPAPAAAFGLRIGPFHIGVPFFFPRFPFRHRLYMRANPNELATPESTQGVTSALLYPNLALPAIFQNVLFPAAAPSWPFSY